MKTNLLDNIVQFVKEAYNTIDMVPLHVPLFTGNEKKYLMDTIDTTFVSSVGAYVDQFEQQIVKYTHTGKAAAIVNGTAALQVALRIAGVKSGEEVITQALTFVATANAIAYNFATPVFVDVDIDTMGMSPKALDAFLKEYAEIREDGTYNKTTGKRIAACVPMHTFGFMCRIDEIVSVCNTWGIPVVEDAAEALGSFYKGKSAGSFGLLATFSFNGNKIITAGGGGVIVSREPAYAEKAKFLTTTAKEPHSYEYVHNELGYNFRMPNLNAALVCAQMEQLETFKSLKKKLYCEYKTFFENAQGIGLVSIPENTTEWNYWLMALQCDDKMTRDEFLDYTNKNGMMTRPIWQLMFRLPMYASCQRDDQKNAVFLEERIINIPSSARKK